MGAKVYDAAIIGGGILGAMTAWKLSRYNVKALVLDRAYDVGEGATKANSGVLYPGFHARGGSLKGISCVKGNAMYDGICEELGIPMRRIGSLYVAFSPEGEKKMMDKYERGLKNGTPDMRIISGDEARRLEPSLSSRVTGALYTPFTGIISPFALVTTLAEAAALNGVDFLFECEVRGIRPGDGDSPFVIETSQGPVMSRFIVNTAGEGAAAVESYVVKQNLEIKPKRGQFYIFDRRTPTPISHVIYQAGDNDEGGTLVAPTTDGNIIAGPTSEDVEAFDDTATTAEGLAHVERVVKKIIPDFDMNTAITNFAGIRANITNVEKEQKDFVIRKSTDGMVSALGIKNPGMTSAPYLTDLIINELDQAGLRLEKKETYKNYRFEKPFLMRAEEEQADLIGRDSSYGRVVCRCENVTEGDIVRVLSSPLPPRSINGFKKRLRTGMGTCQGSYCTSRIIDIICRETGARPEEILKSTDGSNMVKGRLRP